MYTCRYALGVLQAWNKPFRLSDAEDNFRSLISGDDTFKFSASDIATMRKDMSKLIIRLSEIFQSMKAEEVVNAMVNEKHQKENEKINTVNNENIIKKTVLNGQGNGMGDIATIKKSNQGLRRCILKNTSHCVLSHDAGNNLVDSGASTTDKNHLVVSPTTENQFQFADEIKCSTAIETTESLSMTKAREEKSAFRSELDSPDDVSCISTADSISSYPTGMYFNHFIPRRFIIVCLHR